MTTGWAKRCFVFCELINFIEPNQRSRSPMIDGPDLIVISHITIPVMKGLNAPSHDCQNSEMELGISSYFSPALDNVTMNGDHLGCISQKGRFHNFFISVFMSCSDLCHMPLLDQRSRSYHDFSTSRAFFMPDQRSTILGDLMV
jgi:hypothetical protein